MNFLGLPFPTSLRLLVTHRVKQCVLMFQDFTLWITFGQPCLMPTVNHFTPYLETLHPTMQTCMPYWCAAYSNHLLHPAQIGHTVHQPSPARKELIGSGTLDLNSILVKPVEIICEYGVLILISLVHARQQLLYRAISAAGAHTQNMYIP